MIRSFFLISIFGLTLAGAKAMASDELLCQFDTFPGSIHYHHDISALPFKDTVTSADGVIATIDIPDRTQMTLSLEKGPLKAQTTFQSYYDSAFDGTENLTTPGLEKSLIASIQCVELRTR